MGTLSITNLTDQPFNLQGLYITVQPNATIDVERRWDELTAMFHLHEAIADGNISIDFQPSEDELASGLVPTTGTAESEQTNHALYVSPTGDDNSSGVTPVSPLATIGAAIAKAPFTWGAQNRIFFAPGTYTIEGSETEYVNYNIGMGIGDNSEPLGLVGGFDNVLGDRTATAGTGSSIFEDDTLSMTPGEYIGSTILILSGAGAGGRVMITDNDATTLTINWDFGIAPGDTFRVERPNVIFESNAMVFLGGPSLSTSYASGLAMYGIKWNAGNGSIMVDGIRLTVEGCEFELNTSGPGYTKRLALMNKAFLSSGSLSLAMPGVMSDMSFAAGLSLKGGSSGYALTINGDCEYSGPLVQQEGGQYVGGHGNYASLILLNAGVYVTGRGTLRHVEYSVPGRIDNAPANGIYLDNLTRGLWIRAIDVSNCADHGIFISKMSDAYLQNVTGTGNGDHGLALQQMANAWIRSTMTLTGTGGDVSMDGTTIDYATAKAGYTGTRSNIEGQ